MEQPSLAFHRKESHLNHTDITSIFSDCEELDPHDGEGKTQILMETRKKQPYVSKLKSQR